MEQAAGDIARCGYVVVVVVVVVTFAAAFVIACHSTAPSPAVVVGAAFHVSESKWLIPVILHRQQLAHS